MNWLDKLDRRFGHWAVPGLIRIVVILNVIGYVLLNINRMYGSALLLDPQLIREGQVWRLATYLFIPPTLNPIFLFFGLWFLWSMGEALEQEWGAFKLNLFYFTGMIATTLTAFFVIGDSITNFYLNTSVFFAFATIFPDYEILFMLILPMKTKWVALISAGLIAWSTLDLPWPYFLTPLVALGNYLLFFGPQFFQTARSNWETKERRARFDANSRANEPESWHRCVVCKKTEKDNPDLDFRIADDDQEYCMDHLAQAPTKKKA